MSLMPVSLVGRITLWALVLFAASSLLFWALFGAATREISREVVDTRLIQFADQLRGYWASRVAGVGNRPDAGAAPAPNPELGGADVGWVWQISEGGTVIDLFPAAAADADKPEIPGGWPQPGFCDHRCRDAAGSDADRGTHR